MKLIFAALAAMMFFVFSKLVLAESCNGDQTITCFDACRSADVEIKGDTCDSKWNEKGQCLAAISHSAKTQALSCQGLIQTCFDACTNSYVQVQDANACSTGVDYTRNCTIAVGICNM